MGVKHRGETKLCRLLIAEYMAMNSAFLKKRICLLKSMATTAFNKWSRTILFIIFLDKSQTNVSFSSRSSRAFILWASDEKLMSNFWAGLHVHEGPCNLLLGTVPRSKWKPGQTGYFWMPKLRAMLFPLSNYVAIGKGLTAITGKRQRAVWAKSAPCMKILLMGFHFTPYLSVC